MRKRQQFWAGEREGGREGEGLLPAVCLACAADMAPLFVWGAMGRESERERAVPLTSSRRQKSHGPVAGRQAPKQRVKSLLATSKIAKCHVGVVASYLLSAIMDVGLCKMCHCV